MDKPNKINNMEWISVKDRFPEEWVTVLITDGKNVGISSNQIDCITEENCISSEGYYIGTSLQEITHWMPLPEPPKD